jgi:hypothetical protein
MMKPTQKSSMKKPTAKKSRGGKKIGRWAMKGRKKQKGGFLSLIIAGLVALGVEAATAATVASVAAPIVSGVASASAGYATSKILGGSKRRLLRRRVQPRRI